MTIATFSDFVASWRIPVRFNKPQFNTTSNGNGPWGDPVHFTGDPAAVAAVANTTTGVVPTNATAGYPSFSFSGTGYLTHVDGFCVVASSASSAAFQNRPARFILYDRL